MCAACWRAPPTHRPARLPPQDPRVAASCPVDAQRSPHYNSSALSSVAASEPRGGQYVLAQPAASTRGFPGGLRTTGCACEALYSDPATAKQDRFACVACKVCSAIQEGVASGKYDPALCQEATGCNVPLPCADCQRSYYAACGVNGPFVSVNNGAVAVPPAVWEDLKGISCY